MEEETTKINVLPADKAKIRHLFKIALYLFLITVAEFVIAFTVDAGPLRTSVFILMTIAKAFYIVSEFMHLGHEVKVLIWSILIPLIFVVWLVIALLMEGNAILQVH